jgi:hypothetical protein
LRLTAGPDTRLKFFESSASNVNLFENVSYVLYYLHQIHHVERVTLTNEDDRLAKVRGN